MTSILPLYNTLTATAFGIYALINIKICSSSAPATFNVLTLTMALTKATLGMHWRVTRRVLAAILAYNGFVAYIIYIPHPFIASLMRPSLSSTAFWFLLCLAQSF